MFKPMDCPKCGKEPEGSIGRVSDTRFIYEFICWGNKDGSFHGYAQAGTRIGAILRWNAYCRRELRRTRKEKEK